ncbi:hypothetical protein B0H10DRAFT_2223579 [Mycena sp. CBHHK59/15]|nr:hypothetical protein B0H10DRAFT_2223579 [Mycena sp. CBHHK59/15]
MWLKSAPIMAQFIAALGSSCVHRPRRIEMVAEMVSVDTSIGDAGMWHAVEKDSGLSDGDIIGARWIKAPDRRQPNQDNTRRAVDRRCPVYQQEQQRRWVEDLTAGYRYFQTADPRMWASTGASRQGDGVQPQRAGGAGQVQVQGQGQGRLTGGHTGQGGGGEPVDSGWEGRRTWAAVQGNNMWAVDGRGQPAMQYDDQLPTFEQPQAINILHTPSITTTPDYDSDEMPMDAWDGDTDKLSAQDFLRGFHRDVKVSASSADKAKAFKNYLVANSDTDDWYKTLPAATKVNMDLIDIAIEAQYPAEATVQQSPAEYTTDLLRLKLTMEELGTKVTIADREVWAHHAWCAKMMCLVLKANVSTTTTYIEQVHIELLGPLRKNIGKMFANWAAFIKAIRNVNTAKLVLDMKEWHEEKAQRDTVTKMLMRVPPVQASPTAGIRMQLPTRDSDRRCSSPRAGLRRRLGGTSFRLLEGDKGICSRPHARSSNLKHRTHRTKRKRAHHPRFSRRWRATSTASSWRRWLGSSTTPTLTREGLHMGHTNYMRGCDALQDQCVSVCEQRWRRIAAQALKEAPVGVRAVGFGSWDVDDFGRPFGGDEDRF